MKNETIFEENSLRELFDKAYIPLMSISLMLTQLPDAAVRSVREVFFGATKATDNAATPSYLFKELLRVAPGFVNMEGYAPTGFATIGSRNNIGNLPPGKRFPLELRQIQGNPAKPLMPNRPHSVMPTVESWILYPLQNDEEDCKKKEIMLKLLRWLSELVSDAKLMAVLGEWYGYVPGDSSGTEPILLEIAGLLNQDPERARQLWHTQHDLWLEIFGTTGPTFYTALEIWLECIPLSREDFYQECLEYGRK